jgi:hypothetical protein
VITLQPQRRGTPRPTRVRATRPTFDCLEDRMLLYSTLGGKFSYGSRITYSIVPDNTSIGGTPSNLYAKMPSGWQTAIQKAAAVWEAAAGINLVQVSDNGASIGSSGNQQGDNHFGDIRIGGFSQSMSQLAFAFAPPAFNGGTTAGDIFFNTAQLWQTNGNTYDLETCAIHEFGHALGLGHSSTTYADLYAYYQTTNQSLYSDDITGIQSIWGAPRQDSFDSAAGNTYSGNAANITPYFNSSNGQIALANLNIYSSTNVNWYKITVPSSTTGSMVVKMQSSNLSSLNPRITVYNSSLQAVGNGTVTGTRYGDTITSTVSGVSANQLYYIKVMAGTSGTGNIGAYGLLVNCGSSSQAAIAPPYTVVAAQPDQQPTTTPQGTTGWTIGDQFIPYLGILDPLVGGILDTGNGLFLITIGNLSGYGDTLDVGPMAGHGHHPSGGVGDTQLEEHHQHGDATVPGDFSDATIKPLVVNTGADDNHGGPGTMFHLRNEAPRRVEAARLRAVDSVLSGWRSDGQFRARPPVAGGRPSEDRPTLSLSPRHDGDLLRDRRLIVHAWPQKFLAMASP